LKYSRKNLLDAILLFFIVISLISSMFLPSILLGSSVYEKLATLYNESNNSNTKTLIKADDISDVVINHRGFIEMTVKHRLILSEKPITGHVRHITEFDINDFNQTELKEAFSKD